MIKNGFVIRIQNEETHNLIIEYSIQNLKVKEAYKDKVLL